ncbi:MAG TPA: hypothetical protein VLG50_02160 [Candidatus Saccharimonadales bacterium]|nr:hypothetical protein [Candidatus Saccharimonadales bacterium]
MSQGPIKQASTKKVLRSKSRSQSRSPHKTLQRDKKPKTNSQVLKTKKRADYCKENDLICKQTKQLFKLTDHFGRVAPGHHLRFTKDGDEKILTRNELNAMQQDLFKRISNLKKMYIEGSRNSRDPILPSSFKASYTPIKSGPVFVSFLAADGKKLPNFGEIPNEDGTAFLKGTNLLDALPKAREGYFLKNSLTLLLYIYSTVNGLKSKEQSEGQKNIPDDRMNKIFGKQNALYYQEPDKDKVLMTTSGKKLSTYAVVSGKNSRFKQDKIENYYFQSIISLNIYELDDLDADSKKHLIDSDFRKALLNEFLLIENANKLNKVKKD